MFHKEHGTCIQMMERGLLIEDEYRKQRKSEFSLNYLFNDHTTIAMWETGSHDDH